MNNDYNFLESHKINKVAKNSKSGNKILKSMESIPTNKSFLYALVEEIDLLKDNNPDLANQADELGARLVRETNIDIDYRDKNTNMGVFDLSLLVEADKINMAISERKREEKQGKTK